MTENGKNKAICLADIARHIGAELIGGRGDMPIDGVATLDEAGSSQISFLANTKYTGQAQSTRAAAVIMAVDCPQMRAARLLMPNPYLGWARTLTLFAPDRQAYLPPVIHATAVIDASVTIGKNVHIGAHVVIGADTVIGDNVIIHAGVVIEEQCQIKNDVEIHPNAVIHYATRIGQRCVIWSNAVIGAYGFGNARDGARYVGVPQLGYVLIEDDVDIGAGATIDRGTINPTIIRRGVKIDNLVMIAHNVEIGEDSAIASQTGISGSTKIGDRVIIAGQAGFVGHVHIGDDSFVGAKAGISKSFPAASKISGYPARNLMDVRRSDAALAKLPELVKKVRKLEREIKSFSGHTQKTGAMGQDK